MILYQFCHRLIDYVLMNFKAIINYFNLFQIIPLLPIMTLLPLIPPPPLLPLLPIPIPLHLPILILLLITPPIMRNLIVEFNLVYPITQAFHHQAPLDFRQLLLLLFLQILTIS